MSLTTNAAEIRTLASRYLDAKELVEALGYTEEIDWQYSVKLSSIDETTFLRECAWVIFNSGMRETVVRRLFPELTDAFHGWKNAATIVSKSELCIARAKRVFNHPGKLNAIVDAASWVLKEGHASILDELSCHGPVVFEELPFVGKTTSYHLAKNLGYSCAKPDRHLVRLAEQWGGRVEEICHAISQVTGDPVAVVDIVLWRRSTVSASRLSTMRCSSNRTGHSG